MTLELHRDLDWVLSSAQIRIHEMNPSDTSRQAAQDVLDEIRDALSDIQTDNDGQFVIYTGLKDPKFVDEDDDEEDQFGAHVFKGDSVAVDCKLCGHGYAYKDHA